MDLILCLQKHQAIDGGWDGVMIELRDNFPKSSVQDFLCSVWKRTYPPLNADVDLILGFHLGLVNALCVLNTKNRCPIKRTKWLRQHNEIILPEFRSSLFPFCSQREGWSLWWFTHALVNWFLTNLLFCRPYKPCKVKWQICLSNRIFSGPVEYFCTQVLATMKERSPWVKWTRRQFMCNKLENDCSSQL